MVCCEPPCRRCLYRAFHSRNSFKAFTPQLCTDVLSLLITVVSVFEGDLIGFIYIIMKPPLLRVNDALLCIPVPVHQAFVVQKCCLTIYSSFPMFTCHYWLGFVLKAFKLVAETNLLLPQLCLIRIHPFVVCLYEEKEVSSILFLSLLDLIFISVMYQLTTVQDQF